MMKQKNWWRLFYRHPQRVSDPLEALKISQTEGSVLGVGKDIGRVFFYVKEDTIIPNGRVDISTGITIDVPNGWLVKFTATELVRFENLSGRNLILVSPEIFLGGSFRGSTAEFPIRLFMFNPGEAFLVEEGSTLINGVFIQCLLIK